MNLLRRQFEQAALVVPEPEVVPRDTEEVPTAEDAAKEEKLETTEAKATTENSVTREADPPTTRLEASPTLVIPLSTSGPATQHLLDTLRADLAWFGDPVSLAVVGGEQGQVVEAVVGEATMVPHLLAGLATKYPGIGVKASRPCMVADPATGLYTLSFTDTMRLRWPSTPDP